MDGECGNAGVSRFSDAMRLICWGKDCSAESIGLGFGGHVNRGTGYLLQGGANCCLGIRRDGALIC